jgi:hypothetical protein
MHDDRVRRSGGDSRVGKFTSRSHSQQARTRRSGRGHDEICRTITPIRDRDVEDKSGEISIFPVRRANDSPYCQFIDSTIESGNPAGFTFPRNAGCAKGMISTIPRQRDLEERRRITIHESGCACELDRTA